MSNQERRLMRRMGIVSTGPSPYGPPVDPRANLIQETDWQRNRLAEELAKIGLEELYPSQFVDTGDGPEDKPTQTVKDWLTRVTEAALAAAEVIYPEIPTLADQIHQGMDRLGIPLPAAAQEGARAVLESQAGAAGEGLADLARGEG